MAIWTIEIKSWDADTSFDLVYSQSLPQNLPHIDKEDGLTTHINMNENKRNGLPSTDISAVLVSHWSLINLISLDDIAQTEPEFCVLSKHFSIWGMLMRRA